MSASPRPRCLNPSHDHFEPDSAERREAGWPVDPADVFYLAGEAYVPMVCHHCGEPAHTFGENHAYAHDGQPGEGWPRCWAPWMEDDPEPCKFHDAAAARAEELFVAVCDYLSAVTENTKAQAELGLFEDGLACGFGLHVLSQVKYDGEVGWELADFLTPSDENVGAALALGSALTDAAEQLWASCVKQAKSEKAK